MAEKQAKALTPRAAFELSKQDPRAVIIDIRSTMEFLFVGHPTGAIHVPWIDEPEWTINPHFVTDVRKILLGGATSHDDISGAPVILICRSGKRSIDAGKTLLNAGFSEVFFIDEGFEGELDEDKHRGTVGGWRFHNLPWEQC